MFQRNLVIKNQDKIPERNLVDFKPTSIMQIAITSDQKTPGKVRIELVESLEIKQPEDQIEIKESLENKSSKDVDNEIPISFNQASIMTKTKMKVADSSETSSKISSDIPDEPAQPDKVNAEGPTENQNLK